MGADAADEIVGARAEVSRLECPQAGCLHTGAVNSAWRARCKLGGVSGLKDVVEAAPRKARLVVSVKCNALLAT